MISDNLTFFGLIYVINWLEVRNDFKTCTLQLQWLDFYSAPACFSLLKKLENVAKKYGPLLCWKIDLSYSQKINNKINHSMYQYKQKKAKYYQNQVLDMND